MKNGCFVLIIPFFVQCISCGLLGYGTGEGSCAAAPFRAYEVKWSYGCPPFAPCCSEFGYCRPLEEWDYGHFRDCNGISNGTPLPYETVAAEAAAGPYEGKPAGKIGPPPDVLKAHHHSPLHANHVPHPPPHSPPVHNHSPSPHSAPHFSPPHHSPPHHSSPHHSPLHHSPAHHSPVHHSPPHHSLPQHSPPHHSPPNHFSPDHSPPHIQHVPPPPYDPIPHVEHVPLQPHHSPPHVEHLPSPIEKHHHYLEPLPIHPTPLLPTPLPLIPLPHSQPVYQHPAPPNPTPVLLPPLPIEHLEPIPVHHPISFNPVEHIPLHPTHPEHHQFPQPEPLPIKHYPHRPVLQHPPVEVPFLDRYVPLQATVLHNNHLPTHSEHHHPPQPDLHHHPQPDHHHPPQPDLHHPPQPDHLPPLQNPPPTVPFTFFSSLTPTSLPLVSPPLHHTKHHNTPQPYPPPFRHQQPLPSVNSNLRGKSPSDYHVTPHPQTPFHPEIHLPHPVAIPLPHQPQHHQPHPPIFAINHEQSRSHPYLGPQPTDIIPYGNYAKHPVLIRPELSQGRTINSKGKPVNINFGALNSQGPSYGQTHLVNHDHILEAPMFPPHMYRTNFNADVFNHPAHQPETLPRTNILSSHGHNPVHHHLKQHSSIPAPFGHHGRGFNQIIENKPRTQKTTNCQQPVGGGSYTCISFGSPVMPIYAYHTRRGKDGVFFGKGSGFPGEKGDKFVVARRRRRRLPKGSVKNFLLSQNENTGKRNETSPSKSSIYETDLKNTPEDEIDNQSLGSMIQANIQPYEYPLHQMQTQPLQSGSKNDLIFVTPIPLVDSGDAKSDKLVNEFVTPSPKLRKNKKYSVSKTKVKSARKRLSDTKTKVKTKTRNVKKEHYITKHHNVTSVKEIVPRRSLPTSFDELESPITKKKEKQHNLPYPSVFGKIEKDTKRVPQKSYPFLFTSTLPTPFEEIVSPMTKKKEKENNPPYPSVFGKIKKKTKRVPQRSYPSSYGNLGKQKKSFKVFSI